MIISPPKPLNLAQLKAELAAASVSVLDLGTTGAPTVAASEVYTYDASGNIIDIPAPGYAVVTAHVAIPDPNIADLAAAQSAATTNYIWAMTRLNGIITTGAAYTTDQVRQAVIDMALMLAIVERLLRASGIINVSVVQMAPTDSGHLTESVVIT